MPPASIACFISPHGFGHAARSAAVLAAIHARQPQCLFEIYTLVPAWFFAETLPSGTFHYHPLKTDIGLIQEGPLSEDVPATLTALNQYLPLSEQHVAQVADLLLQNHCRYAICDISPLGILAAKRAGIPAILIENFTWDWIYAPYLDTNPGFAPHIAYLQDVFSQADVHILARPFCQPSPSAALEVGPISRAPLQPRIKVRQKLGIAEKDCMLLITMGGIPESFPSLQHLSRLGDITFVIPGGSTVVERRDHLLLLPHHSEYYHPDLIHACDAAVGKAGYSTIAELFHAGRPFGYFTRPGFRESACLSDFIQTRMHGIQLAGSHISQPAWIDDLPALLDLPAIPREAPNGADQIADYLTRQFSL